LKASDIKIGCVYYVDYEPVRNGEFDGFHLSVIIKKNHDKYTFVVMPLTSSANGNGINKVNIGKIVGLPSNLKRKDSYAVFDQIRTVNASRIKAIKKGRQNAVIKLHNNILHKLIDLYISDLLYHFNQDEKISILHRAYCKEQINKATNFAYDIIKMQKSNVEKEKISSIYNEIWRILMNVVNDFDVTEVPKDVLEIFHEAIKSRFSY